MGRAVSRFGEPAGSHPARYSHRSREASAALHSVPRRGDVLIGIGNLPPVFAMSMWWIRDRDSDASFPEEYIEVGRELVKELEQSLLKATKHSLCLMMSAVAILS